MVGSATWGPRVSSSLVVNAGALTFLAFGFWSFFHGQSSVLYASIALIALLTLYTLDKTLGICATFVFLLFLGDVRRVAGWLFGFPSNDPMIVVGSTFAFLIAVPILLRPKLSGLTEKLMIALMAIMLLQVFNPAQGGITVGVIGAVLAFPPMLWFWIGRTVGSEAILDRVLYKVVVPVAVLAALLGYYQVFIGVPIWQAAWVDHVSKVYTALNVGGSIRAFGFSTSASEYMNFLLVSTVVCLVGAIAGRTALLLPIVVLLPAIVLGSQRSTAFRLMLAVVIAFTFKNRARGPLGFRFVVVLVMCVGGFGFILNQLGGLTPSTGTVGVDRALTHEIGGLAHPLDTRYSTAVGHSYQIGWGFLNAVRYPIGFGVGSTGIAATRGENGQQVATSEFEISDAFVNLGLPGGLIYVVLMFSIVRDTIRYLRVGSRLIGLTLISLLFCLIGSWLFNGDYSNGPILWFLIGSVRKSQEQRMASARAEREDAALPLPAASAA